MQQRGEGQEIIQRGDSLWRRGIHFHMLRRSFFARVMSRVIKCMLIENTKWSMVDFSVFCRRGITPEMPGQ